MHWEVKTLKPPKKCNANPLRPVKNLSFGEEIVKDIMFTEKKKLLKVTHMRRYFSCEKSFNKLDLILLILV